MDTMNVDNGGGREEKRRVNYPANSRKNKNEPGERPKQEKVVEGEVVRRKKPFFSRFREMFLSEDSGSVVQFTVMEVLIPAAKNAISDAVSQGIERMLFGDLRPRGSGGRPGYTNYNRVRDTYAERRELSRHARATHDFSDIIIASRAETEDVIERLRDLVDQYGVATVADLYDLVGLTGEFTDDKWGWYDLRSASVRPIRGGYLLNLPRTQPVT